MQDLGVGRRRVTALAPAILAAYVGLLVAGPLGHHDLRCHLTSTTHCTACVQASVMGPGLERVLSSAALVETASVSTDRPISRVPAPAAEPGDRSPPIL